MALEELIKSGYANNIGAIEEIYSQYLADPLSVDSSWRSVFGEPNGESENERHSTLRVYLLIQNYRNYGHLAAKVNPIAVAPPRIPRELTLEANGFSMEDLESLFPTCGLLSQEHAPLKSIIAALEKIYCGTIGLEYMGLQRPELEKWLQEKIEPNQFQTALTIEEKKMILQHLNASELFESFLHTKYVGQKRFSLEGGETLIPMLAAVLKTGSYLGMDELVLGMAHRGRLNVLSNIMHKSYNEIFSEFEESYVPLSFEGSGDVKYHKGFTSKVKTLDGKEVKINLCPNPSHLESVYPVVEGQAYAKQEMRGDTHAEQVVPLIIHGDAALSGQGVVYESMQMSQLPGYQTGGTLHIVINNQIGFTTLPEEGRSTYYCTDIARTFSAPVFHVNGEDPERCVIAIDLALKIRHLFHCDVFIDLNCFRKYGHNEADEPAFTQPLEYQMIRKKRSIRELYRDDLIRQGILERQMAEALEVEFKGNLQKELSALQVAQPAKPQKVQKITKEHRNRPEPDLFAQVNTAVSAKELMRVGVKLASYPDSLKIHSKLEGLLKDRKEMAEGKIPLNWGMGELLAYGTLLWEGRDIRLSGQDSIRGTFSHRHAMLMDQEKHGAFIPLQHLKEVQGRFEVVNSFLSEYACLGFEYGYSLALPEALVIWEAQFGDFCNGAQVVIDQYIATAEQKWNQLVGIVLYLPHGYEGQGPEHSSARMERFLTLCGDDNMTIANPSTPAQLFHLLRRHALRSPKRPLVIFTPKALLRHPKCVSPISDLEKGTFSDIIDDPKGGVKGKKLVFCSGKVYYEILAEQEKRGKNDLTLIRIEQLYPFHEKEFQKIVKRHSKKIDWIWAQEEPSNMGAWNFLRPILRNHLPKNGTLRYVGRERSASPAVGSLALHQAELTHIMDDLFS